MLNYKCICTWIIDAFVIRNLFIVIINFFGRQQQLKYYSENIFCTSIEDKCNMIGNE